jgi:cell division protein FtsW
MTQQQLRKAFFLIIASLLAIGVIAVYSSSAVVAEAAYGDGARFLKHHLLGIACGFSLAVGCLLLPYPSIRHSAKGLILISIFLLLCVMVFGQEVGGAKRWFRIGRWSMQPSEFAQLTLVVYLSDLLARRKAVIHQFWRGVFPPMVVTGLIGGMVLVQPDLGTALVMGLMMFLLLWVAGAKWQHLGLLLVLGVVALGVLIFSAEYRRRRILAFLDPWADPRGNGYQIIQSFCALALGGFVGSGVGGSLQKLFYLPSAHTDFILAVIGEELGFLGVCLVVFLFGLLLVCGFRMAMLQQDAFSRYLICGCVGMLGFEAVINMAVVTGLMPTKGLPLPLISYGGSSMIMSLVACALILQASLWGDLHARYIARR